MERSFFVLWNDQMRAKAAAFCMGADAEARVEIKPPKRTLPQNARMWAMLTDIAEQATWAGKRRTTDEWKDLFTGAVKIAGGGIEAVPGLEGGIMLLGLHTSDMSIPEMADLITYMESWGAQNGVTFSEPKHSEAGRDGGEVNSPPPVARPMVAA